VKALRGAGCKVTGMISVFTYGFKVADENFKNENCPVISLCDYETLIAEAVDSHFINSADLHTLRAWREFPENWGK
jgi:orotate phosphoribosyltransferase